MRDRLSYKGTSAQGHICTLFCRAIYPTCTSNQRQCRLTWKNTQQEEDKGEAKKKEQKKKTKQEQEEEEEEQQQQRRRNIRPSKLMAERAARRGALSMSRNGYQLWQSVPCKSLSREKKI